MVTIREGNSGLTVKVALWSLEKWVNSMDMESARLWIKGEVTSDTGERGNFNDAGELITILGKWNRVKFQELRDAQKTPA